MSMLDSFFNKGFKAPKCKTLLKLTIPRIKLLRNRREIQIKQMRRDIAKLLQTGQEATARIRVEHIIREENMMAAQEIMELFSELISVRLPVIESQRECPLDLKEAISSICFAAPRCADLPELLQVQMLFASKYGKEFVSAATELMPDCGVNRQLIELLSVRAPSPDVKLKLLKEIAEEHELDWDPADSETALLKKHEDLLNGPTQFESGSKLPLPKEKHDEALNSMPVHAHNEQLDSDSDSDVLDFPEVPKVTLRPTQEPYLESKSVTEEKPTVTKDGMLDVTEDTEEQKQFLPFISRPSISSTSFSGIPSSSPPISRTKSSSSPPISRTKGEANVDLQDVLAAAHAAAESAERAAAAARTAASLAQSRISELTKKNSEKFPDNSDENPFYTDIPNQPDTTEKSHFSHQDSFDDPNGVKNYLDFHLNEDHRPSEMENLSSFTKLNVEYDSPPAERVHDQRSVQHQPERLPSMDDESYFSYPDLFTAQQPDLGRTAQSGGNHIRPTD
ncbi:Regulator of Vps4 activity in the MVB pathway protein [Euphorbia peplus]|nr:Regulator of Vps4 activity in the MVB pathway protein [Euphorbia peplus]